MSCPPAPSLSPEELEAKTKLLADIADRIQLARAVWATTISWEVAREIEAWIKKLQEVAATMPHEAAVAALGPHTSLLTQPVQTIAKPQIPQDVQERVLPPSAPSGKYADTRSELYWWRFAPERPREPQRPVGYVPDGLQSLVS